MKTNMGSLDRSLRVVVAFALIMLYFNSLVTGALGVTLLVVAGIFVLTSLAGYCPVYAIFGINSRPKKSS
jgi:hypothetical protein